METVQVTAVMLFGFIRDILQTLQPETIDNKRRTGFSSRTARCHSNPPLFVFS